jgi:hypothetical protein
MDNRIETGREFWRAVLRAGGATAIPRWTLDPAPGVAEHVPALDDDLAAGVRRLADELELPLHSVALAAHAKVLAALSGEQDVVIGYAARPGAGRRDTQVKISGFRIEIGEIENTLLRVDGVRDRAVVVAERADRSKHPVAFYSGPRPLEAEVLRHRLGASLPGYMVPAIFHWRQSLPLTGNSKIDRKALTALAGGLAELDVAEEDYHTPSTPTERQLAAAWVKVLGLPADQISRQDHFFDLGGTSLSAVRLAIALDRAVSLEDLTHHPVLADPAVLADDRLETAPGVPCVTESVAPS